MVYEAWQNQGCFRIFALACVALSTLGFFAAGIIPSASTSEANGGAYPLVGGLIIAGCFGMAAFFWIRASDKRPLVRIDANGIFSRDHSNDTIPWHEITGISTHMIRGGGTILSFHLMHPDDFPPRNPVSRMMGGANKALGFGAFGIATAYLTGGQEGVLAAVRHFRPDLFRS